MKIKFVSLFLMFFVWSNLIASDQNIKKDDDHLPSLELELHLPKFPSLQHLNATANQIIATLQEAQNTLEKLTFLNEGGYLLEYSYSFKDTAKRMEDALFGNVFPRLKKLDLQHFNFPFSEAFAPNLESLTISGLSSILILFPESFAPYLKALNITNVNQVIFSENFAPHLEFLTLSKIHKNLVGLKTLQSIKTLTIDHGGGNGFKSVDTLEISLNSLENFNFNNFQLPYVSDYYDDEFVIDFSRFAPNLKMLNLSGSTLPQNTYLLLTGLNSLETLFLGQLDPYYKEGSIIGILSTLPNLKDLNFAPRGTEIYGLDFREFMNFKSLKRLNISHRKLTAENIEQMQYTSLPDLEILILDACNAKGAKFSIFAPNLTHLSLKNSNITGGDIAEIMQLQQLRILDISSTSISAAALKKLGSLINIKELSLGSTNMTKADFNLLPTSIESLSLAGSTLSIESFNTLFAMTNLKKLDLKGIKNANINSAMINNLKAALPGCDILH